MYRDVGMAVPKTTETRCRDGSVQGRHVIQKTTQLTPSLHLFFISEIILRVMLHDYWEEQFLNQKKKDVGMGLVV